MHYSIRRCITHVKAATYQDVTQFHSRDFVDALLKLDESNPDIVESGAGLDEYGLGLTLISVTRENSIFTIFHYFNIHLIIRYLADFQKKNAIYSYCIYL